MHIDDFFNENSKKCQQFYLNLQAQESPEPTIDLSKCELEEVCLFMILCCGSIKQYVHMYSINYMKYKQFWLTECE